MDSNTRLVDPGIGLARKTLFVLSANKAALTNETLLINVGKPINIV